MSQAELCIRAWCASRQVEMSQAELELENAFFQGLLDDN